MSIVSLLSGAAELAGGIALSATGAGAAIGGSLMLAGAGSLLSAAVNKPPAQGITFTERNPIGAWQVVYGQCRIEGFLAFQNVWGQNNLILDQCYCLASHPIDSVIKMNFDQKLVQIGDTPKQLPKLPSGWTGNTPAPGSGSSYNPTGWSAKPVISIQRNSSGLVTVVMQDIPGLQIGGQIIVSRVTLGGSIGTLNSFNGSFQVFDIVSRIAGVITFTYLSSGGAIGPLAADGDVQPVWSDYAGSVYVEYLLGLQTFGTTFVGHELGTPYNGNSENFSPLSPQEAGFQQDLFGFLTLGITNMGTNEYISSIDPWTGNCSFTGKAGAMVRLKYAAGYEGGIPKMSWDVLGKHVYDPRYGVVSDPFSFRWSNNSALIAADFMTTPLIRGGFGLAYGSDIPLTGPMGLIAAANLCDTSVPLASGLTEPMYTTNGSFKLDQLPGAILEDLLSPMAGRIVVQGGQYFIVPGAYPTSTPATLTMSQLRGPIMWRSGSAKEHFNSCKGTYTAPTANYASGDLPAYQQDIDHGFTDSIDTFATAVVDPPNIPGTSATVIITVSSGVVTGATAVLLGDGYTIAPAVTVIGPGTGAVITAVLGSGATADQVVSYTIVSGGSGYSVDLGDVLLSEDNGERRYLDIHVPLVTSVSQAQRVAKINLLRSRFSQSGTFILDCSGYQYAPLDVISATIPALNFTNKALEVTATRLKFDEQNGAVCLGVEIDWRETDASIYAWTIYEEQSPIGSVLASYPAVGAWYPQQFPWPWSAGYVAPISGDSYCIGAAAQASFGIQPVFGLDASGASTINLNVIGVPVINKQDLNLHAPYFTSTSSVTGGSLSAGTYVTSLSTFDAGSGYSDTPLLIVSKDTIASGTSGSITVTPDWGAGSVGGALYIADDTGLGDYIWHWNQNLSVGQTSAIITQIDRTQYGGPDVLMQTYAIVPSQIVHSGSWADQIQAVTATMLTFGGDGMTAGQWAGYTISLLAKYDGSEVPILNVPIASSTASTSGLFTLTIGANTLGHTLPDLTTLLAPLDLMVMRFNPTFTITSFTDPNISNGYYAGMTGVEAGHIVRFLNGPNSGNTSTISSVTTDSFGNYTVVNVQNPFTVQPNNGDLVVITLPSTLPPWTTAPFYTQSAQPAATISSPTVSNLAGSTWFFQVRTLDVNGNYGPDFMAPYREFFLFGSAGTRTVTADDTQLITDANVLCDTTSGDITFQLLSVLAVPNVNLMIKKISTDANTVTVLPYTSIPFPATDETIDGATSVVLSNDGDLVQIRATG